MYLAMIIFVISDKVMARLPSQSKWILLVVFPMIALFFNTIVSGLLLIYWPFTTGLVPWRLGGVFVAATFMVMGNEIRRFMKLREWSFGRSSLDVPAIAGMCLILLVLSEINGYTDIASDDIGLVWIYLLTGIIGTYIMFAGSTVIARHTSRLRDFLVRVGNSSQEIYELHPMTLRLVPFLLIPFGVIDWWLNPDWWILNSIFICVTTIPLVFYVIKKNKYLRLMFRGSTK